MQSSADVNPLQPSGRIEGENVLNARSVVQAAPTTSIVQTSAAPYSQTSTSPSPPVNSNKPANGTTISTSITQNNRFITNAPLTITPYHIPRGTAAVANISVPKNKLSAPIIRATPVSQVPPSTTISANTTPGFISTLSRPMTTWVVTSTTSSNILQKTAAINIVSSTYVRPPSTMTVTSRIAAPIVTKPPEITKPIIVHNPPKQLLTQSANQSSERNAGGLLKTNVGMVTIRGSTIAPTLQTQSRVSVPAQTAQPPRLTVSVPMLVPSSAAVRKPQTLAPKVITQSTRAPFTVQSIPVSVNHTPSALTMNKKTAITIGNSQAAVPGQNSTAIVRANPTVVASNSMITVTEIRPEIRPMVPSANLLIQATSKPQSTVPSNASVTAFSAPTKAYVFDPTENFPVKRTLVSSSTTAFTSSVSSLTTASIPRHFNVVSSVNANQIPRLNPIMVVEAPRMATSVEPSSQVAVQAPALTIQSYVIPQGTALGPIQQQPPQQPLRISPVPQQPSTTIKPNASPRPSILRKRDIDGSLAKAQRNLTPLLNSAPCTSTTVPSPPPSPHLPDMGGGQSSNSSSTLSATSSPGLPNIDPESPTPKIERPQIHNPCEEEHLRAASLIEMSPRKKPRKQQLTGNTSNEPKLEDDMEFICDDKIKKESKDNSDTASIQESQKSSSSTKKPNISILTGYNHGWKSRHHHFIRYSDVKYKEEKKPSVSDIANQKYVTQKINGWKIYHLSTQMEDLHDIEIEVVDKLSSLLKLFTHPSEDDENRSLNRTNELIMGNMQRSKVVSDQLKEAQTQMLKVFNHKKHVGDIINKYASKRTIKKKGRY